ncbi:MAG: hypothetical protein NZ602_14530 [Thermoguttaceae bacterium]|nr:hypothetical protein [Thermoguttaceae bacterium]MDW8038349.1 hypothetical protein [Thermoguttaceae bacterium]
MASERAVWGRAWYIGPVVVALTGWMAVLATLAPHQAGPGITCDEPYHTLVAKRQVWALERYGLVFFTRPVVEEVFPFRPGGPPAHPPMIHWILGLVHRLVDPAPGQKEVVSIIGARLAAGLGYGLLIFLVGLWTARQAGPLAGTAAALACGLMPRVFAHGHLAALEIWTAFWLLAAVMAAGWAETTTTRPSGLRGLLARAGTSWPQWRWLVAGLCWGFALLSRFHAFLIGPVVIAWLLLPRKARPAFPPSKKTCLSPPRERPAGPQAGRVRGQISLSHSLPPPSTPLPLIERIKRGLLHLAKKVQGGCLASAAFWPKVLIWSAGAGAIFFTGWPWLWYSTVEHLQLYLASATQRQPIHVYYLGRVWLDYQVPWHYPWLIFATTVPVGLLLLGLVGLWAGLRAWAKEPQWGLLAGLAGAGLLLFSWPGVPVYDGERLFLFVYPIWAIFVGLGCCQVQEMFLLWVSRSGKQMLPAILDRLPFMSFLRPRKYTSPLPTAGEGSPPSGRPAEGAPATTRDILPTPGVIPVQAGIQTTHPLPTAGEGGPALAGPSEGEHSHERPCSMSFLRTQESRPLEAADDSGGGRIATLKLRRLIGGFLLAFVALQGVGLVFYHPCQLSYYNLLVGSLAGADRLGLEVNYWADAVREPLLQEAAANAPGQPVLFAPHLAPFQAPGIAISSPALTESQTELIGWDPNIHSALVGKKPSDHPAPVPSEPLGSKKSSIYWLIVYHRKADLAVVEPLLAKATVVAEYSLQGVWLARLLKLPDP